MSTVTGINDVESTTYKFSAFDNESDNSDDELFKPRKKTSEELDQEKSDYKKWLAGQVDSTKDADAATDLKPLKDYWNDPKLSADEKFLKDYILNKRYLSNEDDNYIPTYDEIIHDSDDGLSGDEQAINNQEEFEYKFNFRFEEPDQDFIKRYPRTIEKSLRKPDDRRKVKRAETKLRKQKEKEEKMAEIKKLQELKRKEIEEKIEKIKEVTGDIGMEFQDDDIEGDFDPEAHDRRMQQLFSDEFYEKPENEQKPEFPDIDEELEIEKWDDWENAEASELSLKTKRDDNVSHCEDDNFIMDADYDPESAKPAEKTKRNKKGKRKSKVAEALAKPKPKYDPNDKNCEKYFDEYYKLDCEDIIGDIPCRFKYRSVLPNDFGLSVEEILLAKDRELNKWVSLKKAVQYRPDHVEKYEQHAYSQKAKNVYLKKKILPSLFNDKDENEDSEIKTSEKDLLTQESKRTKSKKIKSIFGEEKKVENVLLKETLTSKKSVNQSLQQNESDKTNRKKKTKRKHPDSESSESKDIKKTKISLENDKSINVVKKSLEISNEKSQIGDQKKKKNKKNKKKKKENLQANQNKNMSDKPLKTGANENKKKNQANLKMGATSTNEFRKNKLEKQIQNGKNKRNNKKDKLKKPQSIEIGISDNRLAAYGLNPKKFKNKLKYGKSNS